MYTYSDACIQFEKLISYIDKSSDYYRMEMNEYALGLFIHIYIDVCDEKPEAITQHEFVFYKLSALYRTGVKVSKQELHDQYKCKVYMQEATRMVLQQFMEENHLNILMAIDNECIEIVIEERMASSPEVHILNLYRMERPAPSSVSMLISETAQSIKLDTKPIEITLPDIALASFISGFDSHIICSRVCRDGKHFATSTESGIVHLWSTETNKVIHTLLLGHNGKVFDMDFSNDGKYLLTGGIDGDIRLWSTEMGRCLVKYRGFDQPVWYVRFSSNNSMFCAAMYNSCYALFNTDDIQFVYMKTITCLDITSVQWSPTNDSLFFGSSNGSVYRELVQYDPNTMGGCVYEGNGVACTAIAFDKNRRFVLCGYENGELAVYGMSGRRYVFIKAHERAIRKILLSDSSDYFISIGEDGCCKLWVLMEELIPGDTGDDNSFMEESVAKKARVDNAVTLKMIKQYSVSHMEFIDAVYVKAKTMVIAGVSTIVE